MITTVLNYKEELKKVDFPKLMVNPEEWVCLLWALGEGVWISGPYTGICSTQINISDMRDYDGDITIKNKVS